MPSIDPLWVAPRQGQDWICEDTLRAVRWLKAFVPEAEMERRLERCREQYLRVRESWENGEPVSLYDQKDSAAWFVFQGQTYAEGRSYWAPDEAALVVPYLSRIGQQLDHLKVVKGAEERAARMMLAEKAQPESAIFELLVGAAYKRHGWHHVEFVSEDRGGARTPDLYVRTKGARWAVECKRLRPSSYAVTEKQEGKLLAKGIHQLSEKLGRSFVVEVRYHEELKDFQEDYLLERVAAMLGGTVVVETSDGRADIRLRPVDWGLTRAVMDRDFVYVGSTRMIELLCGHVEHSGQHSVRVRCRRATEKPSYADAIYHASVVSWMSYSDGALSAKAKHFRRKLADAEGQLPKDRPGVVHIGMESVGHDNVDYLSHFRNFVAAHNFSNTSSRLRWVYGNYFLPEVTTRQNESCALVESMAPYRIGPHRTREPLPGHLLVADDADPPEGLHWDGRNREA